MDALAAGSKDPVLENGKTLPRLVVGGAVKLLLLLGPRRSETLNMRWADVDEHAQTWTVRHVPQERSHARRSAAGVVDLMLAMVEAGTEQSVDLGYAGDSYFASLERVLRNVVEAVPLLPAPARPSIVRRLQVLAELAKRL